MRNLLALIGLLVVGGAAAGWYLGWYKLSYSRTDDGTLQIKTDVDTKKASHDASEAVKNVGAAIGEHVGKAAQDAKSAPDAPAGATPGPVTPSQNSALNPLAPAPVAPVTPAVPLAPPVPPVPPVRGPLQLVPPK
jgi:hypothetical protein